MDKRILKADKAGHKAKAEYYFARWQERRNARMGY